MREIVITFRGFGKYLSKGNRIYKWNRVIVQIRSTIQMSTNVIANIANFRNNRNHFVVNFSIWD